MKKRSNITELSVQELRAKSKEIFISRKIKDSDIDYSDIPKFTRKQLAQFQKVRKNWLSGL